MDKKRVVYIKSLNQMWLDIIEVLDERHGWTPVLWVGNETPENEKLQTRFPDAHFYMQEDAFRGCEPRGNIELDRSETLNVSSLTYLAKYEPVFYEMMNRWCVAPDEIPYEDRRLYFLTMVRIWIRLYKSLDVDIVVCPALPHRIFDYAAYLAAQFLNIQFLFVVDVFDVWISEQGERRPLSYVAGDLENRTTCIQTLFQQQPDSRPSEYGERHLELMRQSYKQALPSYFQQKLDMERLKKPLIRRLYNQVPFSAKAWLHKAKSIATGQRRKTNKLHFPNDDQRDGDTPVKGWSFQEDKRHGKKIKMVVKAQEWYQKNVEKPDFSSTYIYLAPHFQPERTTTPDAGLYQHTELILETLAAVLPEGWRIYYKEHPSNFRKPIRADNMRNVAFYQRMRELAPQISFVDIKEDPFVLIENAKAIATATGTTGWQAVTRGKPALIFGDAWYDGCPGVFRINSVDDVRRFIEVLPEIQIDPDSIAAFLAAIESCSWDLSFRRDADFGNQKQTNPAYYGKCIQDHADAYAQGYEMAVASKPSRKLAQ